VTLEEFENQQGTEKMRFILDTIEGAGSKAEAARRLGVSSAHLFYLIGQSKAAKAKEHDRLASQGVDAAR